MAAWKVTRLVSLLVTSFYLVSAVAHGATGAPVPFWRPANDNAPPVVRVTVCDETLAEFAPVHRIPGAAGEVTVDFDRGRQLFDLRTAGLEREADSLAAAYPQVLITGDGLVVLVDQLEDGRFVVHRSVDPDHPFSFEKFHWLGRPAPQTVLVAASKEGDFLAFRDVARTKVLLVEARSGRKVAERAAFDHALDGAQAHFHPGGGSVTLQRDGLVEVLDLTTGGALVKGVNFGHAMKAESVEPDAVVADFEMDTRGDIFVLASRDRAVQFFRSEPPLRVALGKNGTYQSQPFERAPPTVYEPTELPEGLGDFERASFQYLDRAHSRGRGTLSARETFAAEYRFQYPAGRRQSFLDVYRVEDLRHVRSYGVPGTIHKVTFSPDERFVALATLRKSIRVYDLRAGEDRAWVAIDDFPLLQAADLLEFTVHGDLVVGSTAEGKLVRYALPR